MKNTQKKIIVVTLLLVALCLCFTACNQQRETDVNAETVTLVFTNGDDTETMCIDLADIGMILTEKTTLNDLLYALNRENDFKYTENGGYINSIHTLIPNADNHEFVSIYTSVTNLKRSDAYGEMTAEKTSNEITVYPAGVGIKEIPIKDDETYLFVILHW